MRFLRKLTMICGESDEFCRPNSVRTSLAEDEEEREEEGEAGDDDGADE